MLLVNARPLPQVYYDQVGETMKVDPGVAQYFGSRPPGGGLEAPNFADLAVDGVLRIKRHGGMGDLLFLTPVFNALTASRGLKFIVECAPEYVGLLDGLANVSTVKEQVWSRAKVDLSMACETAERDGWAKPILRTQVWARMFNVELSSTRPVAVSDEPSRKALRERLGPKPIVVLQTAAAAPDRSFALPIARSLAKALTKEIKEAQVVVIGWNIPGQMDGEPWTNLGRNLSMLELKALIAEARVFVGLDSGPSYLSVALGRPTIICMTTIPTYARVSTDWAGVHVVRLEKEVNCKPCWGGHEACGEALWCVSTVDTSTIAEFAAQVYMKSDCR